MDGPIFIGGSLWVDMTSKKYIRITKGVASFGELKPRENFDEKSFKSDNDYYYSVYYYNEAQYKQFTENGSVKGIRDVITDKIVFDFDNEQDLDAARQDTVALLNKLETEYNIPNKNVELYFSGNKGFGVIVNLENKELTPHEHEVLANTLAGEYKTFDTTLYDSNQILRIPNTKHPESGLYKIALSPSQLKKLPIDIIKNQAKRPQQPQTGGRVDFNVFNKINLNKPVSSKKSKVVASITPLRNKESDSTMKFFANGPLPLTIETLDLSKKPSSWRDYKWSLLQGNFNPGERHQAMMVLAATCRGLGYDADLTTFMLMSADEKHCKLTKDTPIDDLESNIIPSVFNDGWNGGQYSYKNNTWLQEYTKRLGTNVQQEMEEPTIAITDALGIFKDYAKNIKTLTVKTGIDDLDKRMRMTVGMLIGIVAGPGAGKTSASLEILNSMSKSNEQAIFFSYDMYHSLVIQKLIQKHLHTDPDEIFSAYENDDIEYSEKVANILNTEYKNVEFCFKVGQTPDDIVATLKYAEEKTGKKVRLIVVDYSELVISDKSDATAASADVIQRLRAIAALYNVCVIVLLQPNKMSGTPADEISSYRNAKGSSAIEQAVSLMLGISRPGYDPKRPERDKFMTINCVKNRMGPLFSVDLHWEGFSGKIRSLTDEERDELAQLRADIANEKAKEEKDDWK